MGEPAATTSIPPAMASNSILIVEDEAEIRELLAFALDRAGYSTIPAATAEEALARLEGRMPALAIIDWMLPGASGVELARKLRRDELTRELPLIMLTARGEEADKLRSFESGIDDYVTKPFSPRELVARVKALLRRSGAPTEGVLEAGDLRLDVVGHRLTIGGENVHLGPTEFRLLEYLMQHPNRAFDRAQLLDRVWGRSVYVEERTVDVHILRLRKALSAQGRERCIETVRGVGYRFVPA
jgi:two-component system phosphate regulon response regulator PhoB